MTNTDSAGSPHTPGDLGRELKYWLGRRSSGSSVAAVARRLHVSQSSLYAYLAGTTVPPPDVFDELLRELEVPATEFGRLATARDSVRRPSAPPAEHGSDATAVVIPAELPADPAGFVGREAELALLDERLADADRDPTRPRLVSITGTAGVGKTALAVRWAHRRSAAFPDGCLYADLRGWAPTEPQNPDDVLAGFLRSLGVDESHLPSSSLERASRLRTLLTQRRLLIVLDNALDADQVRPLLPGRSRCLVLITSRADLAGLQVDPGARTVAVRPLSAERASELLRRNVIGPTNESDDSWARMAELCAGLPLALRIVAARMADGHGQSFQSLREEIAASGTASFDVGDPSTAVAAVLSWSIQRLPEQEATDFWLLGAQTFDDFDVHGVAALLGVQIRAAAQRIHRLVKAHVVERAHGDRYTLHDLMRAFARERVDASVPAAVIQAASTRFHRYLVAAATMAADRLHPTDNGDRPHAPLPWSTLDLKGDGAARAWLENEWRTVLRLVTEAAARGEHRKVIQLVDAIRPHLNQSGRYRDAVTVLQHSLVAARALGDVAIERTDLRELGAAQLWLGRHEQARESFTAALAIARAQQDPYDEAGVLNNLGGLSERLEHFDRAMAQYREALTIAERHGMLTGRAILSVNIGWVLCGMHRPAEAAEYCLAALALFEQIGDHGGAARALTNHGESLRLLRQFPLAVTAHEDALQRAATVGAQGVRVDVLNNLAAVHLDTERWDDARDCFDEALTGARANDDPFEQSRSLIGLGRVLHHQGRSPEARAAWQHALALEREHDTPRVGRIEALLATLEQPRQPAPTGEPAGDTETAQRAPGDAGTPHSPEAERGSVVSGTAGDQ